MSLPQLDIGKVGLIFGMPGTGLLSFEIQLGLGALQENALVVHLTTDQETLRDLYVRRCVRSICPEPTPINVALPDMNKVINTWLKNLHMVPWDSFNTPFLASVREQNPDRTLFLLGPLMVPVIWTLVNLKMASRAITEIKEDLSSPHLAPGKTWMTVKPPWYGADDYAWADTADMLVSLNSISNPERFRILKGV